MRPLGFDVGLRHPVPAVPQDPAEPSAADVRQFPLDHLEEPCPDR